MTVAPLSAPTSTAIEWLRIALVAQVALGHYALIALPRFATLDFGHPGDVAVAAYRLTTRFGAQAAYAFVFLSGFFLVPQLAALARQSAPVQPFILRRLRRIYPTLVAAVALTFVCDLAGTRLLGEAALYRTIFNYDAVSALDVVTLAGNVASLQPTFVSAFGSNAPLWTLGYLVQFYIVGALVAALFTRSAALAIALVLALIVAAAGLRPEWLALMLTWAGAGAIRALPAPGGTLVTVAIAVGVALFVAANLLPPLPGIAATAVAAASLLTGLRALGGSAALPGWAVACSRASFAIYAFHLPLAMLVFAAFSASGLLAVTGARAAFIVTAFVLALVVAIGWERATRNASAR